jgi:hypothetical protein
MIGAVPAVAQADATRPSATFRASRAYAVSGFGARGLVWASLAGELLASQLNGDPLPLERDLVDAMDPARYLLKPPRPARPATSRRLLCKRALPLSAGGPGWALISSSIEESSHEHAQSPHLAPHAVAGRRVGDRRQPGRRRQACGFAARSSEPPSLRTPPRPPAAEPASGARRQAGAAGPEAAPAPAAAATREAARPAPGQPAAGRCRARAAAAGRRAGSPTRRPPPAVTAGWSSVEAVQQKGEGSGLGAVGGAILGGVLGHQVGEGSGKQIARIGGAVLGGLAGNEVEALPGDQPLPHRRADGRRQLPGRRAAECAGLAAR